MLVFDEVASGQWRGRLWLADALEVPVLEP